MASPPSLLPSYGKALAGAVLPGGGGDNLPEAERTLEGVEVRREQLAAYDRVCGFRLSDRLPATYPHVLAFPLAMALMTERSFPFPLLGLVHVGNRIEQRRPLDAAEPLDLRVWAEDLRPHRRGRQLDVVAEAGAGGEPAWVGRSTYLRREGSSGEGEDEGESGHEPRPPEPPETKAVWKVPGDVGRRYAEVSGDRNPIHLHSLTAKLFGFPRAIAHGMWMKARCLAALEGAVGDGFTVEVEFRKPLLIPGTAEFGFDGRSFALGPHLTGTVS
ncbi:MAG: MaoC/PaaZ C-terminal domain-containing protein [Thermoleophilaceae bacterium]